MKFLIIGSQGLIGSALTRCLPNALQGIPMEATEPNQIYIDIMKYETLLKVFTHYQPDIVYLAAAISDVNKCEDFGTATVNVRGTTNVLRLCEQFGSKFVWFSSSYVFDGLSNRSYLPDDPTNPLQSYGIQKVTVENLISQSEIKWLIVRTVGVFGTERKKKNFAKQVISSVFLGKTVYAPDDQWMNPILSNDLARITIELAERGANDFYHVAGDTCVTKYEFAKRIAGCFGYENLVKPVRTEDMNQKALRPKMGCLDCSSLENYNIRIPNLNAGLQKFLASEYNG
jgi:dTDP-4-dehydrorhamnose reductase